MSVEHQDNGVIVSCKSPGIMILLSTERPGSGVADEAAWCSARELTATADAVALVTNAPTTWIGIAGSLPMAFPESRVFAFCQVSRKDEVQVRKEAVDPASASAAGGAARAMTAHAEQTPDAWSCIQGLDKTA